MRVISRYSTQLKAEAGLRYRGKGEVVYLESPDYPKHGWALVDVYEPKPFPPRASSEGGDERICRPGPNGADVKDEMQGQHRGSSTPSEGVPGVFVCREEDIG